MKYSKRLKSAGATGIVLAMTANFAEAGIAEVQVNQVIENFGTISAVSFDPVSSDFFLGYDNTSYDAIARNCGLSLIAFNGMQWSDAAVNSGDTVDGSLSFGNPGFPPVPADGVSVSYGYAYTVGTDTFYGFAQFTGLATGSPSSRDFLFDRYVYEDSAGTAITVSAVPEPSAMAAIIALSGGLFTLQRRKRR